MTRPADHTTAETPPLANDVKVFVPSKDFNVSVAFYEALGWRCNWRSDGLAEMELAAARLYLQKYYTREWAENSMIFVDVDDAQAWYAFALGVIESGAFPGTRVEEPRYESYGAFVTFVWDPSGVLIHFAQRVETTPRT